MESEKFSSSGLYWLCKEAENRSSAVNSPVPEISPPGIPDLKHERVVPVVEAHPPAAREKRRRGRPPKGQEKVAPPPPPPPVKRRKKKEDEDVCFICFDGGNLVLCDRGDCPKAYHPACIKHDEAFFTSNTRWTCGWHICSKCQKSAARYMCYTCTYSLCKGCAKDTDYLLVRGNKGFCSTCFQVVMMIENIDQGNKNTVQVDFDDKLSWEYLFKVYWICLKKDLSLTVDEIIRAQKPSIAPNKVTHGEKSSAVHYLGNNGAMTRVNRTIPNGAMSCTSVISVCDDNNTSVMSTAWASKELLDFVAYMRNGDTSALSQKEVQALLFDYIKRNNLRDPHQRSEIICDSKLENLFGKPRVRHFEMLSLLEFHFLTKDESQKDEIDSGIIDPVVGQVTGESNSDNLPIISENYRHKVDKKHEERVDINRGNEGKDACEKLENRVESSGSTNNNTSILTFLKSEALSGLKSETSVASHSTGSTPSANDRETENSWHYRDPCGKVLGPLAIEQLHKRSSTGIFPPDMRIWRLNTEEHDSVLLADIIKRQVPLQNNLSSSPQEVKGTSDSSSHHCDGPSSGCANSAWIDTDAHSNGKLEIVEGNGSVPHSSNHTTPAVNKDPLINNDCHIDNSSKCLVPDLPKVINSHSNPTRVHSVERSSAFAEQPHETSVHQDWSNGGQTWNPTPNCENMASQASGRHSLENHINEERYFGQPSSEGPLHRSNSVNNWNSHVSHPHYTSMANLSDSSEQFRLQDFPLPIPKTSTGVLEVQTIEQQKWRPPQVCVQNLSIQNVLSLTPKSIDHDEKVYFQNQKMASQSDNFEKIQSPENRHSLSPNCSGVLESQTIKEQQRCQPPQVSVPNLSVQSVPSLTPKSIDRDERDYFQSQKMASLTNNLENIRASENKNPLSPNCPAQDSGASWSSASSLVLGGGNHLPRKVTRPSMEEWDSSFLSASSLRPHDGANDHVATPTSNCEELPPSSPPNPVPNASSWLAMMTEPIEFNTLAEESVSDLLAEVDAMESNSDMASPYMLMDYVDDLFNESRTDCFTSLRGLSSPFGRGKNDGLISSGNIMLPPQSDMRDEQIQAPDNDVLDSMKKSKKQSPTRSVMEMEAKLFGIPANQFESGLNRDNLSPPKKTRDLADIMNAPTKNGNLTSPGSSRRELGQGTPRGSGSKNRSISGGMSGRESSRQKHGGDRLMSPRDQNASISLTSPRDRNVSGGDSGFSKGRPSWSRQSSFGVGGGGSGSGSHSRSLPRGQRASKFHEKWVL